jgi:hypothetical protein
MMLEKTPRMVCFPVPGSMCTASHSSQARSCGLDFTFDRSTDAELEAGGGRGQFILHGRNGFLICGVFDSLAEYPHWFVVACATLAAAVILWVLLRLLRAALWLLFFGVLLVGCSAAIWLLFR